MNTHKEADHYTEWPRELISAFNNKRVVIFTGSGLSCRARSIGQKQAPTWSGLLEELLVQARSRDIITNVDRINELKRLIKGNSVDDHLVVAEYIKRKFEENGRTNIKAIINQTLKKYYPDKAHDIIARLPVTGYISTNYDTYLEDEYGRINGVALPIYSAHSRDALSAVFGKSGSPWMIKLHGQIGFSENFVLSFDEYEEAYASGKIETLLTAILSRYTVLFIGFGFRDPPIMGVLRSVIQRLGTEAKRHYALGDDKTLDVVKSAFLQRYFGIDTIRYPKLDANEHDDTHRNFHSWIDRLSKELRSSRTPSVRLLIDFRIAGSEDETLLYSQPRGNNREDTVLLWPSIEWPHLPPERKISDMARHSFLNAMRDQFGIDGGNFAAIEIRDVGKTFIDPNKGNISDDNQTYDFYFQFITIFIKASHSESFISALSKSLPHIRKYKVNDVMSHEKTLEYNRIPLEVFRDR